MAAVIIPNQRYRHCPTAGGRQISVTMGPDSGAAIARVFSRIQTGRMPCNGYKVTKQADDGDDYPDFRKEAVDNGQKK